MLDVSGDLLLLIELQPCLFLLVCLLCQPTRDDSLLVPLLYANWSD